MTDQPRERWDVQPGDRFLPYVARPWMNEHDHGWNYRALEQATTLPRAIKRGLAAEGSDDFNIAVIRGGVVVATLLMEEVVDEEPDVLWRVAEALNLLGPPEPQISDRAADAILGLVETGRQLRADRQTWERRIAGIDVAEQRIHLEVDADGRARVHEALLAQLLVDAGWERTA